MKKQQILLFLMVLAIGLTPARSQETDTTKQLTRDYQNIIQGGVSFGYYGYGYIGSRTGISVPVTAAYEKYIHDYVSVGGFIGYAGYRYEDVNDQKYGWTFLSFGARGSYHFIHFLNEALDQDIDSEKFDFYISLMLIMESRSFSSESAFYDNYYDNEFNINIGPVAGFRYIFTDNLSLYFEGGRGTFGYGTLGVSYFF
jgi:hypothetical protein